LASKTAGAAADVGNVTASGLMTVSGKFHASEAARGAAQVDLSPEKNLGEYQSTIDVETVPKPESEKKADGTGSA